MWLLRSNSDWPAKTELRKIHKPTMMTYYVYKTVNGTLKLSDQYCAHEFKIHAKTLTAAKTALTNYKKTLKPKDGE